MVGRWTKEHSALNQCSLELPYLSPSFFHGNWILAVAAYDSGERTVSRAVKHSHQKQFWSLRLPHETKAYIPRLLALSEIIQHPKRYHIQLPNIPEKPYFQEVEIGRRINLNRVAKLAEMPPHDLIRLNPGIKTWSTQPSRPYKLLIPTKHLADFNRNMACYLNKTMGLDCG